MAAQVKGLAFKGILSAVERVHGAATAEKIRGQLHFGSLLVTGNWYPIDHYKQLLDATVQVLGNGPMAIRAVARQATLEDFRGIYRVLTFVLSP